MRYGQIANKIKDCLGADGSLSIREASTSDPQMDAVVIENWDALCIGFQYQIETYDALPGYYRAIPEEHVNRLRNMLERGQEGAGSRQWLSVLTASATQVNQHIPLKVLASTFATSKSEEARTLFISLPPALRGTSFTELDGFNKKLYRLVLEINAAGDSVVTFGGFYQGSDVIALIFSAVDSLHLIYDMLRIAYNAVEEMRPIRGELIRQIVRLHDIRRNVDVPKDGEDADVDESVRDAVMELAEQSLDQLLKAKGKDTGGEPANALRKALRQSVTILADGAGVEVDETSRQEIAQKAETNGSNVINFVSINGNNNYVALHPEPLALPPAPDSDSDGEVTQPEESPQDTEDTEE